MKWLIKKKSKMNVWYMMYDIYMVAWSINSVCLSYPIVIILMYPDTNWFNQSWVFLANFIPQSMRGGIKSSIIKIILYNY